MFLKGVISAASSAFASFNGFLLFTLHTRFLVSSAVANLRQDTILLYPFVEPPQHALEALIFPKNYLRHSASPVFLLIFALLLLHFIFIITPRQVKSLENKQEKITKKCHFMNLLLHGSTKRRQKSFTSNTWGSRKNYS